MIPIVSHPHRPGTTILANFMPANCWKVCIKISSLCGHGGPTVTQSHSRDMADRYSKLMTWERLESCRTLILPREATLTPRFSRFGAWKSQCCHTVVKVRTSSRKSDVLSSHLLTP
jgi:hypothetical protein